MFVEQPVAFLGSTAEHKPTFVQLFAMFEAATKLTGLLFCLSLSLQAEGGLATYRVHMVKNHHDGYSYLICHKNHCHK